jgi:selenium metabolism protein YedF
LNKKILILITTDRLGSGDDTLGEKLMTSYLTTLKELGSDLWQVIFLNGGVKLTVKDSPVLDVLKAYEENDVKILACGTCLKFFGLADTKMVGESTNMVDIVTATQLADKVITVS